MKPITDEKRKFVSEYCGEYAVALHERLGLPIYVLQDVAAGNTIWYAFVSADGGKTMVDARGEVPIDDIKAICALVFKSKRVAVSRISRENLMWELGIVENEVLAEARQMVAEQYPILHGRVIASES